MFAKEHEMWQCLHKIDPYIPQRVMLQRNFNSIKFAQSACTAEIDEQHWNAHVE